MKSPLIRPTKKTIFLIDALGALLSIFILGIVLPVLQPFIGMPTKILYGLALAPITFCPYSLFCFFRVNHHNTLWLKGIILGNSLYCIATSYLIFRYFELLTMWGLIYFALEFLVMTQLIGLELKLCLQSPASS